MYDQDFYTCDQEYYTSDKEVQHKACENVSATRDIRVTFVWATVVLGPGNDKCPGYNKCPGSHLSR